jgi:hypothetical protein
MNGRLQALKDALNVEWGELATMLDVSRSWIDQMRGGTKPGPKLERRLQAIELRTGVRTAPSEESLLCEPTAEYCAEPKPRQPSDKTDMIAADVRAMKAQIELMTKTINLLLDERNRREKP